MSSDDKRESATKHGKSSVPTGNPPKPPPPPPLTRSATTSSLEVHSHENTKKPHSQSPSTSSRKKPALAPKPGRIFNTMTLPSFRKSHKSSTKEDKKPDKIPEGEEQKDDKKDKKLSKQEEQKDDKKERKSTKQEKEAGNTSSGYQLREASLWKLPGLSSRRHSTGGVTHDITLKALPHSKTPPGTPSKSTSQTSKLKTASELHTLPATPPEHRPLPPTLPEQQPLSTSLEQRPLPPEPSLEQRPLPPERPPPPESSLEQRPLPPEPSLEQRPLPPEPSLEQRPLPPEPSLEQRPLPPKPSLEPPPMPDTPPSTGDKASADMKPSHTPEKKVSGENGPQVSEDATSAERGTPSGSLSLGELVEKYSKSFPLQIKVLQGYCTETSQFTISTDDEYYIRFVKHTKAVKIKDEDGCTYSIPLGSAMKFGLVYNPNNKYDEALNGLNFEKVSDIAAMSSLPKVVHATKAYQVSDEKASVEENELFVVRHVHKPMFKGKRGLKVLSLLTKSEKMLPDECAGYFSTKPSLVRMHLPEIIQYIPNPFPSQAVMYSGSDASTQLQDLPKTLSRVVTMYEYSTETSLVASSVGESEENSGDLELFDIPLDDELSEIEVKIIEPQVEQDPEHVYDDTISVLKNFDPSKLKTTESGGKDNTQSFLKSTLREGHEHEGVSFEPAYVNIPKRNKSQLTTLESRKNARKQEEEEPGYATVGTFRRQESDHSQRNKTDSGYDRVGHDVDRVGHDVDRVGHDVKVGEEDPRLECWMEDLQSTTHSLDDRLKSLEDSQTSVELNKMQTILEQLTKKLESVDSQLQQMHQSKAAALPSVDQHGGGTGGGRRSESVEERNRSFLSTLDTDQVVQLLGAMDLGQYGDTLSHEHITGEILVECDDEVLQYELGMGSRIHRIRLMKVIQGQHSAQSILQGAKPD